MVLLANVCGLLAWLAGRSLGLYWWLEDCNLKPLHVFALSWVIICPTLLVSQPVTAQQVRDELRQHMRQQNRGEQRHENRLDDLEQRTRANEQLLATDEERMLRHAARMQAIEDAVSELNRNVWLAMTVLLLGGEGMRRGIDRWIRIRNGG